MVRLRISNSELTSNRRHSNLSPLRKKPHKRTFCKVLLLICVAVLAFVLLTLSSSVSAKKNASLGLESDLVAPNDDPGPGVYAPAGSIGISLTPNDDPSPGVYAPADSISISLMPNDDPSPGQYASSGSSDAKIAPSDDPSPRLHTDEMRVSAEPKDPVVHIDDNGGHSIDEPTPLRRLSTNAETGEPISDKLAGSWEGLPY